LLLIPSAGRTTTAETATTAAETAATAEPATAKAAPAAGEPEASAGVPAERRAADHDDADDGRARGDDKRPGEQPRRTSDDAGTGD